MKLWVSVKFQRILAAQSIKVNGAELNMDGVGWFFGTLRLKIKEKSEVNLT